MMENSVTVYFMSDVKEWKRKLEAAGATYKVTNSSDYSGVEFIIEWTGNVK